MSSGRQRLLPARELLEDKGDPILVENKKRKETSPEVEIEDDFIASEDASGFPNKRPKRAAALKSGEATAVQLKIQNLSPLTTHMSKTVESGIAPQPNPVPAASRPASLKLFFTVKPKAAAGTPLLAPLPSVFSNSQKQEPAAQEVSPVSSSSSSPVVFSCDLCGKDIIGTRYSCDMCAFDICHRCVKRPAGANVRQVTVPSHPHSLVAHSQEIDLNVVSGKVAAETSKTETKPVYSIFDKAAWSSKKKKAEEAPSALSDAFPALKPGEPVPEFFLTPQERQKRKEERRREQLRRESVQTQSELKATFASDALHPFLLPNENYSRASSSAAPATAIESNYGRNLPLFPSVAHVLQVDNSKQHGQEHFQQLPFGLHVEDDLTITFTDPSSDCSFFKSIASQAEILSEKQLIPKKERVSPVHIISEDERPAEPISSRITLNVSGLAQSDAVKSFLNVVIAGQTELAKRQCSSQRTWGGHTIFSAASHLDLAHLAEIPDPSTFEQPDAPYEMNQLQEFVRSLLQRDSVQHGYLWCSAYRPLLWQEVAGRANWASFVHTWLGKWRDAMLLPESAILGKRKRSDSSADEYDFEVDADEDSVSGIAKMSTALLIPGPIGSGKTASIYACANQLGFNIIEVNPSSERSGQQIKNMFGEATQSHRATTAAPSRHTSNVYHKKPGMASNQLQSTDSGVSLILFEEVDNLFPEDKGFFGALGTLLEDSKRPIVITCEDNRVPRELVSRSGLLEWPMRPPSSSSIFVWLNLILLAESLKSSGSPPTPLGIDDVSALCRHYKLDLRRVINALQFAYTTSANTAELSLSATALGLDVFMQRYNGLWPLLLRSSTDHSGKEMLEDCAELIKLTDLLPPLLQPHRSLRRRGGSLTEPITNVIHLNWLPVFSPLHIPMYDSLFGVTPTGQSGEETALPADRPLFVEGTALFNTSILETADSYSCFDILTSEHQYTSHHEQWPLPAQRHSDMASVYLASRLKVSAFKASKYFDKTELAKLTDVEWAPDAMEDIVDQTKNPLLSALWRFVPPLQTSRVVQRDYLPMLERMCFIEDRRRQLNTKRRFQERLQLKAAAVTALEVGMLTLLAQPAGFPTPPVPETLA